MKTPYSQLYPAILSVASRTRVGKQFKRIIAVHFGTRTRFFRALDIGCTGGTVTKTIAPLFKTILGIDPDKAAIAFAKTHSRAANVSYRVADALALPFKDASFDFILCNQVYEFVPSDRRLMEEIYRVLRPGGWCLLGAANKMTLIEAQYKLPFLHWLPAGLASTLVRRTGRGPGYSGRYRTYWELKKLVKSFVVSDYSLTIIKDPRRFGFYGLARYQALVRLIPNIAWPLIRPFIPNYLWLLQKPNSD